MTGAKGGKKKKKKDRDEGFLLFCFVFWHHRITKEHDLRAGGWEDGVRIIVMTDNHHEDCEHCLGVRWSFFSYESESVGTILHFADMLARGYASML